MCIGVRGSTTICNIDVMIFQTWDISLKHFSISTFTAVNTAPQENNMLIQCKTVSRYLLNFLSMIYCFIQMGIMIIQNCFRGPYEGINMNVEQVCIRKECEFLFFGAEEGVCNA